MTVVIGVDVATRSVRAVAADPDGTVLAEASRELPAPSRQRPGWSEQEPSYSRGALAVLREVTAAIAGRPVAGISVSATSGTIVPCDGDGVPVGPALLYDDRRAAGEPGLEGLAGEAPALARVAWLTRHRPAARYLHVSDVVVAALAGEIPPADVSHALKTGADPVRVAWPEDLLASAAVDPRTLPSLALSGTVVTEVGEAGARDSGLPAGTPLVLGMTDGCTGQIAAGAVMTGDSVGVLGTTLVLKSVAEHRVESPDGAVYSHRAPPLRGTSGTWWPGGASNAGAGTLGALFPHADLAALDAAAERRGPATTICYPLVHTGERFPFARPDAEGFRIGTPADEAETYRSVLEGVAFTERLGFAGLAAAGAPVRGTLRAVGGGSRSPVWLRIRATVQGRPVEVPQQPASGFGAAVLAAAATVHDGLPSAAAAMVRTGHRVEPDEHDRDALEASYARFIAALRERGWLDAG
jgi:sugar (pentulose or hexulose) kinase